MLIIALVSLTHCLNTPIHRVCPGQNFAMNSLFLAISNILASYTIAKPLDENGKEIDLKVDYTSDPTRLVVFIFTVLYLLHTHGRES